MHFLSLHQSFSASFICNLVFVQPATLSSGFILETAGRCGFFFSPNFVKSSDKQTINDLPSTKQQTGKLEKELVNVMQNLARAYPLVGLFLLFFYLLDTNCTIERDPVNRLCHEFCLYRGNDVTFGLRLSEFPSFNAALTVEPEVCSVAWSWTASSWRLFLIFCHFFLCIFMELPLSVFTLGGCYVAHKSFKK